MDPRASKEELIQEVQKLKANSVIQDSIAKRLCQAIQDSHLREKELQAIMDSSKSVLQEKGFTASARAIFDHCTELIGATSGYVALLSETGEENEVLFLEAGGLPCSVDPELPMPIRGLRAQAYYTNKAVYHNDFMNSEWVDFMPKGHVALKNVMFAPLVIEEKTVGIIGLANKETDFNDNDAKMATGFGELAAIALSNSWHLDERLSAEKQKEQVIKNLNKALMEVKTLSGLLPICSKCKKIRDDKGYWNTLEAYIEKHSDASFSHGMCIDCSDDLYGDQAWYIEMKKKKKR